MIRKARAAEVALDQELLEALAHQHVHLKEAAMCAKHEFVDVPVGLHPFTEQIVTQSRCFHCDQPEFPISVSREDTARKGHPTELGVERPSIHRDAGTRRDPRQHNLLE